MTTDEPQIPIKFSEILYVAMAAALNEIERAGYPTHNLMLVLNAYETSRDAHLHALGWTDEQIKIEQAGAIDAVTEYLEARALPDAEDDFAAWIEELNDDHSA